MQDDISNMQYYILLASSIKLYENRNISELIPELKAAIKLTKKRFQYIKKSPINTGQIEDLICLQDFSILFIHLEILNQLLFTN